MTCGMRMAVTALSALMIVTGCNDLTPTDTNPDFAAAEVPDLPPPSDFVAVVTNPYFPLIPGTVFTYRSETDEGVETGVVSVTNQTKTILGISATVVHDVVSLNGTPIEDTFDWYAQDKWGNVWYLGEASCEIVNNECVSTEGSWEAGVDGAEAGIIMWADPAAHKGQTYQQEFYEGVAEDRAKVLKAGLSVELSTGAEFSNCVETMDWTPLEPSSREHKYYCFGTGLVLEVGGGQTRNELVGKTGP